MTESQDPVHEAHSGPEVSSGLVVIEKRYAVLRASA